MKIKANKLEKELLKRYDINVKEVLEEAKLMGEDIQIYIDQIECCYEETRGLWPLKNIQDELIVLSDFFEKVQIAQNKESKKSNKLKRRR